MKQRVKLLTSQTLSFKEIARLQVEVWGERFRVEYLPDPLAGKQDWADTWNRLTIHSEVGIPNPLSQHHVVIGETPRGRDFEGLASLNEFLEKRLYQLADKNKTNWMKDSLKKNQQSLF